MKIILIGTGYVGLVSGACFAEMGARVICLDRDEKKLSLLREGIVPFYEPALSDMVIRNTSQGRLSFSSDIAQALPGSDIVFIAVGTPSLSDGSANLSDVEETARQIGRNLRHKLLVVVKSTVPPGTCRRLKEIIREENQNSGFETPFHIASNPEFLKEGSAINDFMRPDRVIVGADSPETVNLLQKLYSPFMLKQDRLLVMDTVSAEMSKYVSNSMLAARISLMNEVARLCEATGANIQHVREGVGSDTRIGNSFLYAGCGYGGSCFPKDIKALIHTARQHGLQMDILESVERCNQEQKLFLLRKVERVLQALPENETPTIALWGLAFKPETDDIREAPAMTLIEELLKKDIRLQVYDPGAMDSTRNKWGTSLTYADNMYEAARAADILVLLTEWKEFRLPDWSLVHKLMRNHYIVDGRNLYPKNDLELMGFSCTGIGC